MTNSYARSRPASPGGIAYPADGLGRVIGHNRMDVLAMIERGDFDET